MNDIINKGIEILIEPLIEKLLYKGFPYIGALYSEIFCR